MERFYIYTRMVGRPDAALIKITSAVQNQDLASRIPLVKLERGASREFYVFLALDGLEIAQVPPELKQLLRNSGIRIEDHLLTLDNINRMVAKLDIEIHGFNSLEYKPVRDDAGDPFEPPDAPDVLRTEDESPEMSKRFERLLWWISVRGEGTYQSFVQACITLGATQDMQDVRSILRRMRLLGHMECSDDGRKWAAAPAALVRFPSNDERGFLAGQRTPALLNKLREICYVDEIPQYQHQASPCVEVTPNGQALRLPADSGMASIRVADVLPNLNDMKSAMHSVPNPDIAQFDVEMWDGNEFVPCNTIYEESGRYYGESGMYRLSRSRRDGYTMTLFFDEPEQRWLRGDWYGLRFLTLECPEAVHDFGADELLIPASQRWPMLYERALVLASGRLPTPADNPNWLRYSGVPVTLAQTLCGKLYVHLEEGK